MSSTWLSFEVCLPLTPLIATSVHLSSANRNRVRMYCITCPYFSPFFSDISSANLLFILAHSGPMPPVVVNTSGVKVAFSTFKTLSLYILFFWFSFSTNETLTDVKKRSIPFQCCLKFQKIPNSPGVMTARSCAPPLPNYTKK